MTPALPTSDETNRLQALRRYDILDTLPERALDELAALTAEICGVPIALISLVDEDRQWFKARVGFDLTETPRTSSFCGHTVHQSEVMLVPDALQDPRFADNPLVVAGPRIRFYAGAPLFDPDGHALGALCVMDVVPRNLTDSQRRTLEILARQVMTHLELRRRDKDLSSHAESTARLAAIVESSDDAIIGKDLNGIVTSWNRGAEHLFGYSAAEMIGAPITRLIPAERVTEEGEILALLRAGQSVEHFETIRVTKDGRSVHVSVTSSPIRNPSGQPIGASKIARNITDRKHAEAALEASMARYRALFEYAPDGLVITDAANRYLDANPSICRMLGYRWEELIEMRLDDVVIPTETGPIAPAIDVIKASRDYNQEWTFQRVDGTTFAAEVRANRLPDGNILSTIRDVTERQRAAEQIEQQAALLDQARDAILVRRLDGVIQFWNKGAERMYGWTKGEACGTYIGSLIYADAHRFEELNQALLERGEWQGELRQMTKDRRELTVEARWTIIRDAEGRPKSVLAINTDVTERKKLEAQFLRAQRMESIGTLAGGVAHDLNNILSPILMSIDLLKMTLEDPPTREILDTIEISARRGADIVRQVLSFARGLESVLVKVQSASLLRDLESIIKDTFPKDIRLNFIRPKGGWHILGDPTQLHQVLLNLAVNARDAMPQGGNLTITAENCELDSQYAAMNLQAKPGRYVLISVTDTGTGMTPDIAEKIFDPFFTTKDVNKGTGLGLSTVMAIVKSHSGVISVYSEPGKGTTFKLYLPAFVEDGKDFDRPDVVSLPRGRGETILVVDDEASILSITRQTLEAFGYRVLTASDGAQAVAVFAMNQAVVAAVLTDMMMPIMDGVATIHALRRIRADVKIIAASGLNAGGEAGRAEAGTEHFLLKPYTAATLLTTLRPILDK